MRRNILCLRSCRTTAGCGANPLFPQSPSLPSHDNTGSHPATIIGENPADRNGCTAPQESFATGQVGFAADSADDQSGAFGGHRLEPPATVVLVPASACEARSSQLVKSSASRKNRPSKSVSIISTSYRQLCSMRWLQGPSRLILLESATPPRLPPADPRRGRHSRSKVA